MSLRSTSVCSLLKLVYVAVILSLQGRKKEIHYITLNGRFLFKVRWSHFNKSLRKLFFNFW